MLSNKVHVNVFINFSIWFDFFDSLKVYMWSSKSISLYREDSFVYAQCTLCKVKIMMWYLFNVNTSIYTLMKADFCVVCNNASSFTHWDVILVSRHLVQALAQNNNACLNPTKRFVKICAPNDHMALCLLLLLLLWCAYIYVCVCVCVCVCVYVCVKK